MPYNFQNIPQSGSSDKLQPKPDENNRVVLFHEGEGKNKSLGWYTEEQIKSNPNLLFLFGDNDDAKYRTDNHNPEGGGQAVITRPAAGPYDRLPSNGGINGNAIGITTTFYNSSKYTPSLNEFKVLMDKEFEPIETWVKEGGCVVIPCDNKGKHSLGTGIAGLERKIPGAIDYIQSKVNKLVELGKQQSFKDPDLGVRKKELHTTLSGECEVYDSKGGFKNYLSALVLDVKKSQKKSDSHGQHETHTTPRNPQDIVRSVKPNDTLKQAEKVQNNVTLSNVHTRTAHVTHRNNTNSKYYIASGTALLGLGIAYLLQEQLL